MKKQKVIILSVFLTMLIGLAWATELNQIPAPFNKAKELALEGGMDEIGQRYIWRAEISKNGDQITYSIFYYVSHPYIDTQIVIQKKTNSMVKSIAWLECKKCSGHFFIFTENTGWQEIKDIEAMDIAFRFFRELVENNLI